MEQAIDGLALSWVEIGAADALSAGTNSASSTRLRSRP